MWTLDRLVTDDYVLVYLHGGATRLPAFIWMKRCYQMVGWKLRKNLSHLYLVHPTFWIRTMLFMAKPFIRLVCMCVKLALVVSGNKIIYRVSNLRKVKYLVNLVLESPSKFVLRLFFLCFSSKFYRKISYVHTLKELCEQIPLEATAIPDKVKAYDSLHCTM